MIASALPARAAALLPRICRTPTLLRSRRVRRRRSRGLPALLAPPLLPPPFSKNGKDAVNREPQRLFSTDVRVAASLPTQRVSFVHTAVRPVVLTVREGPRAHRERTDSREAALERLGALLEPVVERARAAQRPRLLGRLTREIPAKEIVYARFELRGAGRPCGVDVRADGSVVPFSGRWRRRPLSAPTTPKGAIRALSAHLSEEPFST